MVSGSLPGAAFPLQSAFPGGPCEVSYDPDWEVPECHKLHIHLVKKIPSAAQIEGQENQSPPLMQDAARAPGEGRMDGRHLWRQATPGPNRIGLWTGFLLGLPVQ